MNPKQYLTKEEVYDFFSQTAEFAVTEEGDSFKITYEDDDKYTSVLVYNEKVNIQSLIRKIKQLVWNHCNNILD